MGLSREQTQALPADPPAGQKGGQDSSSVELGEGRHLVQLHTWSSLPLQGTQHEPLKAQRPLCCPARGNHMGLGPTWRNCSSEGPALSTQRHMWLHLSMYPGSPVQTVTTQMLSPRSFSTIWITDSMPSQPATPSMHVIFYTLLTNTASTCHTHNAHTKIPLPITYNLWSSNTVTHTHTHSSVCYTHTPFFQRATPPREPEGGLAFQS